MLRHGDVASFGPEDVRELYYITPIKNVPGIFSNGLLSRSRVNRFDGGAADISNPSVQSRRAYRRIMRADGARKPLTIHQHVNLYINAHNAMMYVITKGGRRADHLCVLRIRKELLQRADVIFSNKNAAVYNAKFMPGGGFAFSPMSSKIIRARCSVPGHLDVDFKYYKQVRQAEVLVPRMVDASFIGGIYVPNQAVLEQVQRMLPVGRFDVEIKVDGPLFFVGQSERGLEGRSPLKALEEKPKPVRERVRKSLFRDPALSSDDEDDLQLIDGGGRVAAPEGRVGRRVGRERAMLAATGGRCYHAWTSIKDFQSLFQSGKNKDGTEVTWYRSFNVAFAKSNARVNQTFVLQFVLPEGHAAGSGRIDSRWIKEVYARTKKGQNLALRLLEKRVQRKDIQVYLKPNIRSMVGDLFKSHAQVIVNTVNCRGVMGKGIAKKFKQFYPTMFANYKVRCRAKEVKVGEPYLYRLAQSSVSGRQFVLNFPTKQHWRNRSKMEWIEQGLSFLVSKLKEWNIVSIAMPPLGCGCGGLRWEDVKPKIVAAFKGTTIAVHIYEPLGGGCVRATKKASVTPKGLVAMHSPSGGGGGFVVAGSSRAGVVKEHP